mgnify:CR=1 FL=1
MENTTETTENTIEYVPTATITVNTANSRYDVPVPVVLTADEVSQKYRDHNAIIQREATKIRNLDKVQEYLLENYDDLESHADKIAEILDIELTKTVTVRATVEFELDITLAVGQEVSDVMDDMVYEATLNWTNDATLDNVSVYDESWDEV